MEPRTEAGRELADDCPELTERIRAVEREAGIDALAFQVADMKAQRKWMRPWEDSFSRYEWAYAHQIDAAINVLELRLLKVRRGGKNTLPE